MIEIVGRRIRSIEAVTLDRATLRAKHFISDDDADVAANALREESDADATSVEILAQHLPAG